MCSLKINLTISIFQLSDAKNTSLNKNAIHELVKVFIDFLVIVAKSLKLSSFLFILNLLSHFLKGQHIDF